MAHFAKLNASDIVERVEPIDNSVAPDEAAGIAFMRSLYGEGTEWVQTSYGGSFRKNFAGPGDRYDRARNAFIAPQNYPSWTLDEATCRWVSPAGPKPSPAHEWNEELQAWRLP